LKTDAVTSETSVDSPSINFVSSPKNGSKVSYIPSWKAEEFCDFLCFTARCITHSHCFSNPFSALLHVSVPACLSTCMSQCPHVSVPVCLNTCLSQYLHVSVPSCLSTCMSQYLHVSVPACLSTCMSQYLHVCAVLAQMCLSRQLSLFFSSCHLMCYVTDIKVRDIARK
jgi:hypothetical protein